jgi:hypothetical protein
VCGWQGRPPDNCCPAYNTKANAGRLSGPLKTEDLTEVQTWSIKKWLSWLSNRTRITHSVQLYLDNHGAIQMFGYDSGPGVQAFFCKDDYECWVTVPPTAVARLAFALLKEKFTGNLSAVHDLRRRP